jgi:hypothetical protein
MCQRHTVATSYTFTALSVYSVQTNLVQHCCFESTLLLHQEHLVSRLLLVGDS